MKKMAEEDLCKVVADLEKRVKNLEEKLSQTNNPK